MTKKLDKILDGLETEGDAMAYHGTKQLEISIDYEVVDNIVKSSLLEMYEELKDSQEKIDFDNLEDFQKENYEYDKTLLEATKILLCYYTAQDDRPEELMNL